MGTDSKPEFSNGNTYPAISRPWGMSCWLPQTGKMGNGRAYQYEATKIRGFKQTHQPSPWMNDYGQFALMPGTGKIKVDEDARASWFSHKAETARPYYYGVYLADYDLTTEVAPTERAARFRFTFPRTDSAWVVIDALDKGSMIRLLSRRSQNYRKLFDKQTGLMCGRNQNGTFETPFNPALVEGAVLNFERSAQPNTTRGRGVGDAPFSMSEAE